MTSNAGIISWALAHEEEDERIREFGSIKPCIWGSDAHEYERMFKPAGDKYCWIKAETTFDGLRQILYEPEVRVCIQKEVPDSKKDYLVIDLVEIEHDNFVFSSIDLEAEGLSESTMVLVSNALQAVVNGSSKEWLHKLDGIVKELEDKVTAANTSISSIKSDPNFIKAERLFIKNKEYQDLSKNLSKEQSKMNLIRDAEQMLTDKTIQTGQCLQELVETHVEFYKKNREFCDMVHMKHGDISITARLVFKNEVYQSLVESYFHGRAK